MVILAGLAVWMCSALYILLATCRHQSAVPHSGTLVMLVFFHTRRVREENTIPILIIITVCNFSTVSSPLCVVFGLI